MASANNAGNTKIVLETIDVGDPNSNRIITEPRNNWEPRCAFLCNDN